MCERRSKVLLLSQVAALSWLEFCKLWKDYMSALREGLADVNAFAAAHPGVECPTAKRLARLVYETGDRPPPSAEPHVDQSKPPSCSPLSTWLASHNVRMTPA